MPDKISVATEEGICGLYLANANADPSELAVVGTWGQDPICEGAVTPAYWTRGRLGLEQTGGSMDLDSIQFRLYATTV